MIVCTPLYIEQPNGDEREFDVEWEISGKDRPATFNDPAEYAEFEVREIRDEKGEVVAPDDYEKLGITDALLERAQEDAAERAADYESSVCRCRGEHCRC